MSVKEFKALASTKTEVPVDKMRLVFGGKQLQDEQKVNDYGKLYGDFSE